MQHYLNCLGQDAGMEPLDLCVLCEALQAHVVVVQISKVGDPHEFVVHYGQDVAGDTAAIHIITEDGRHYNVCE